MNKKLLNLSDLSRFLDNLKQTFASLAHKHSVSDLNDSTTSDINFNSVTVNRIILKDITTGQDYYITMDNGIIKYDVVAVQNED